jgi:hypothetical protein
MKESELKPAICVLNPDDVYNLRKNHSEDSYYCVTPHEALALQEQGVSLPATPHLQEGLVLTKMPNGLGYYYRTDETDCRVINERCLAIEAILSYLGGKEFRYSESSSFRSHHKVDVDVEAGFKKGGIEGDNSTQVNTDVAQGAIGDKSVTALWNGKYTKEGYARAVELAKANGLFTDPAISTLLEQRSPKHPNAILLQEYHVNVTADLDKNVHVLEDISANLKGKFRGNLKVDVQTSRKIDTRSTVDFFVSFDPIPVEEAQAAAEEEARLISSQESNHRFNWVWPAIAIIALVAVVALLVHFL